MSSLIQGDLGNLIHGISQQPDERKLKGQLKGQLNCRSNIKRGPERRAGFELVGQLLGSSFSDLDGSRWLLQESGDGSAFLVGLGKERPAIWDIEANRLPFSFGAGAEGYYTTNNENPITDYTHQTVLDTTFLSNRNIIPKGKDFEDVPSVIPQLLFMDFGTFQPGTKIEITSSQGGYFFTVFDGYVTVNTSSGVPDREESVRTEEYNGAFHAKRWASQENTFGRVTHFNNWVRVDMSVPVKIQLGGEVIKVIDAREIKAIEKLPPFAHNGDILQVVEGQGEDNNKGWFRAEAINGQVGMTEVRWAETTAPGSIGELIANTMPHRLVRDSGNNFSLVANSWDRRLTGSDESNPYPSFITNGTPITAIGLFQNRLFMTSGEAIHLSTTDEFYNLWNESAFFLTDADPFEALADTDEINVLRTSHSFDGDLVFFSDNAQFIMSGEHNHTYADAFVQPASQYKSDLKADPVSAGDVLFFATDYGNYAGIREYHVADFNSTRKARPITQHVDELIPGNVRVLTASKTIDVLACLADEGSQGKAYFYEYLRDEQEVVQQAWSEWELPEGWTFEWIGFSGSTLFAVIKIQGINGEYNQQTLHLMQLKWDDPSSNHGLNFPVRLDGIFEAEATYNAELDLSSIPVPFKTFGLTMVEGPESEDPGFEVTGMSFNPIAQTMDVPGDIGGLKVIGGMKFMSELVFAMPTVKDHEGHTMSIDRLNMGRMFLHFTTVGQVNILISDDRGRTRELTYNNRRTNAPNNLPSYVPVEASTWPFSVRKNMAGLSIKLYSNDVTPFTVRAVEWKGSRTQKGRRV